MGIAKKMWSTDFLTIVTQDAIIGPLPFPFKSLLLANITFLLTNQRKALTLSDALVFRATSNLGN